MRYADAGAESVGLITVGAVIAITAWSQRGRIPAKQFITGMSIGLALITVGVLL